MSLNELLPELLKLNHDEMAQAIQILQHQIVAADKPRLVNSVVHEIWTPTNTHETAAILREVLQESQGKHPFDTSD